MEANCYRKSKLNGNLCEWQVNLFSCGVSFKTRSFWITQARNIHVRKKNAETETGSKSVLNWMQKSQPLLIGTFTSKLLNNYPLQIENEKNIGDFF